MKKKAVIIVQVLLLVSIVSTGVFALKNKGDTFVEKNEIQDDIKQKVDSEMNASAELVSVSLQLEKSMEGKDFPALLEEKGLYPDEIAEVMEKFLRLSALYQFLEPEVNQLYQWISDGCDLMKLLEIYEFAQDTDNARNWQYVKLIYDKSIEIKVYGKNWIEVAFNALTENRGGILSDEELKEYIDAGISLEEIQVANIMSRKGQKSIQQILDDKLHGKSWAEVAESIYAVDGMRAETFKNITEAKEIYNSIVLADITGMEISDVISDKRSAYQKVAYKNQSARNSMGKLGIPKKDSREVINFAKEKLSGTTEDEIQKLLLEGHTIRELEKYNLKAKKAGKSLSEYLK